MSHKCHAIDCTTKTSPELLMCKKHWDMVPLNLKTGVIVNFQKEQCEGKQRPTVQWLKAARKAITHVAHLEGKISILRAPTPTKDAGDEHE